MYIYIYIKIDIFNLGLVAQWTRAHGYEPCGRGFESLLAQIRKVKKFYLFIIPFSFAIKLRKRNYLNFSKSLSIQVT